MPPTSILLPLEGYGLVELTGEDRLAWLQGQVTGDVSNRGPGDRRSFCFVEPTGGLLAVVDAWIHPDRVLMTTARACIPALLDRVERMTILEDVLANPTESEGFILIDPTIEQERLLSESGDRGGHVLRSTRFRRDAWEVWSPSGIPAKLGSPDPTRAESIRLEAGVPHWGIDMGPKTLPPELGTDFERRHVDYDKGCYTGQEVLMRLHSRGHTNRTWVGLVSQSPLEVGAEVRFADRPMGKVSSTALSPDLGPIAAATLRNEATEAGTRVSVGDLEAEVRPMPLLRTA